MKLVCSKNKIV